MNMFKFLCKWLRLVHRWLTPPFIPLLMTANIMHGTALGNVAQSIVASLTVILSITGDYLWLAPYLSKWHRSRQTVASQSHSPHVAHN
jgi:hypothetical protein